MKKCLLVLTGVALATGMLFAQPANDDCTGAIEMNYAATEAELTLVSGDTRGATLDANVPNSCSATWTADDVWFYVTMPVDLPNKGIVIRTYFGTEGDDVPAVGMAVYEDCGGGPSIQCFSSSDAADDRITLISGCTVPGGTYYVRVWSGGAATDFSGTFRIGAYGESESETVLWEENFADGLEGWTTFGTCGGNADSNANAVWRYFPDGIIDDGSFSNVGVGVTGGTGCNGGVGVDSDFDDNGGLVETDPNTGAILNPEVFGTGRCPTDNNNKSQYILQSPAIDHSEWGVAGITLTWVQGLREYQSDYFVGYRTYANNVWSDWRNYQVNDDTEFPINSAHFSNDRQRLFLGGAEVGDSLQIRFVYNANYYYWGIDDIRLVEAPCVDLRSMSNWYAIAPAVQTQVEQVRGWFPLNDIYNAGACAQDNVTLNFTVTNSGGVEVYNQNLDYGTVIGDSLAENKNFATPVTVPNGKGDEQTYTGVYTLTSAQSNPDDDYDFSDNTNSVMFMTTTGIMSLETGFTRSLAPATGNYDAGAPYGYVYGAYYYLPKGNGYRLNSVTWGANNASDIAGLPISIILYKWVDLNKNETVEATERDIVAFGSVEFNGSEPDNSMFETPLESFDGSPDVLLEDNSAYIVVMEYRAADQTSFFILASEDYNYGAVNLSGNQGGIPTYASVLGLSSDGNVDGIDYGVDGPGTFGFDIVPVMRMNIEWVEGTKDILPVDNIVKLYPNPADETLNLDMEFTERMEHVQLSMLDISGKAVLRENYRNMENASLQYDVRKLVPGTYTLQVSTDKGTRAVPFVVQH